MAARATEQHRSPASTESELGKRARHPGGGASRGFRAWQGSDLSVADYRAEGEGGVRQLPSTAG